MKYKNTTPEIEALMHQVADLQACIDRLNKLILEKQLAMCPSKRGDLVEFRGVVHRLVSIEPFCDTFWATGNPRRKDGKFGTAVRNLYADWTPIKFESL